MVIHVQLIHSLAADLSDYHFNFFFTCFNFDFLSTSQQIGSEEHLQYDLFSVEWGIEP